MPKTASPSLFQLIRSLSQTEKRYLKLFLKNNASGESDLYARLFDAIDQQQEYDERPLKSFPHLAVMKVRLEENILWSLRDFHSSKSVNVRLKADLRSAELLFDKGLMDLSLRQIIKSKKLAEQNEEFLALYELIRLELKIHNSQSYSQTDEKTLKELYHQADQCLEKVRNANQYALISDSIYFRIRKSGFFRNEQEFSRFARIMNDPLLRSDKNALSTEAMYYFHSAQIGFSELQADYKKAYAHNRQILALLESRPVIVKKQPRLYLTMLQNTLVWQYQLKEFEPAIESALKLKSFALEQRNVLPEHLFNRTMYYTNIFLLLTYSRIADYAKGVRSIREFQDEFSEYKIKPYSKEAEWMFFDAAAIAHFGAGNYQESARWQNKIIQDKEGDLRSDMQAMARIFALILHFELGNQELLRYMVKWTYRFLIKRNRLYKFETIILEFIRKKIQHLNTRNERVNAFIELKKELEKLLPDRFQRRPLDDFEFIEWLDSKIQNKPFGEVVRKKQGSH